MEQQKIVNAYKVVKKYENEKLPLDISYGFFKLKKILQAQWDFEIERERALFEKYNPTQDENGNFIFKTPEDQQNFTKELAELLAMDCDWDENKIRINFDSNFEIPISDIEALDDFVIF